VNDEARAPASSEFGTLLRRYRLAAGLSQEALAERARLSTNGIGALERGYRRSPQRETIELLMDALGLGGDRRVEFQAAAARSISPRGPRPAGTSSPRPDAAVGNMPFALTGLVGREAELSEVARFVRESRLVTITGAGGVGKTQTALHVPGALDDGSGDHAVCFVALAPLGDASLVAPAVASALGLQEVPDRPLLETLIAYLKSKRLLLILDNCEHVITQAAAVAGALLSACPSVRILATSRESLRVAGERTYRLPSLTIPSAMILFVERARSADHRFALSDESEPIVAKMCRHLDGIPLAIELAAARVNVLSIGALAEGLENRFRILSGGARTALARQQTMRAAIDWSYDLLSSQEQRLFERLSVFAGGCTLATASRVCASREIVEADVLDLLASLVDKSLAVADFEGIEPRYRLLESFRQYAREILEGRGEADAMLRRYSHASLELAEQLEVACDNEPDEVWRALAQEELDNWRAALHWSLTDRHDILLGQRLVGEMHVVWAWFAPVEGRRYTVAARALVDEQTPARVLARLGYAEAIVALQLREYKEQLSSSESSIENSRAVGDALGIARAQGLAGQALASLGRVAEARALLPEALAAARRLGNRRLVASILRNLGYASAIDGDLVAARSYVSEAVPLYEALGAELGAALAMDDLGECEFQAGNAEAALALATKALATMRRINHRRFVAFILSSIAMYLIALSRFDEAQERARESLDLARELEQDALVAWTLQHLGAIAALRSLPDAEQAPVEYANAARTLGFVDARLAAMGSARMYIHEQEYRRALVELRGALGADQVAALMAEGAAMTAEQVVRQMCKSVVQVCLTAEEGATSS
jgi:predicted ATPase/transcriptional regulator with XRE-family HTH domain